jgi:molybdopterin converting factor small subunit
MASSMRAILRIVFQRRVVTAREDLLELTEVGTHLHRRSNVHHRAPVDTISHFIPSGTSTIERAIDRLFANRAGCGMFAQAVSESAPNITIHVFGQLREYCAGAQQLSVSARTVRAVLEQLERAEPLLYRNLCDETGKVRRHLNVFVNNENARDLDGVDTTLAAGDVVTFLPAVSGG